MKEDDEEVLKQKLQNMEETGINLFLNGKPDSPENIARICVCEDMLYMADYVFNDFGVLEELRYNRITDF